MVEYDYSRSTSTGLVVVYRGSRTHSTEVVLYLKHQLKQKTEINSRV